MARRILIVEDEIDFAEPIRLGLSEDGYEVEIATSGRAALLKLEQDWDLIILDLMLPDMSGETVLNNLKQRTDYPPVLVLTARSALDDKLALFRQGCDDYLTKPVIFEELIHRVHALLRRSHRVTREAAAFGDIQLNFETGKVVSPDGEIMLTPKEATILRFFFENAGKVLTRKEILQNVWGLKEEPETNFIGVHIFNLRKKLSGIKRDKWLQTIRNSGFMLDKT